MTTTTPKLILHGGFFSELPTNVHMKKAKQEAMAEICRQSWEYLQNNSAADTVVHTVSLLEDEPLFNAGLGSQIQSDGHIRMSAAVMDSHTLKFGGVMNIENIKNPIRVARKLTQYHDRVLAGEGATHFARSHRFEEANPETPFRREEYEQRLAAMGLGTVGCVALDASGMIAAATSTGGKGFEMPGRVSDSATVAGNYANQHCGVSCTGIGEDIVSLAIASRIVTRVTDGMHINPAFDKTFAELKEIDGYAGAIGIDRMGNICWRESHLQVVYAFHDGKITGVFQ